MLTATPTPGYLANISFLRIALSPKFHLHDIRRTGPLELTTRWTMDMELSFNRWVYATWLAMAGDESQGSV